MWLIYYLMLITCGFIVIKLQKNIYSPAFIVTMIWFLFPLLYEIISRSIDGYSILSNGFYACVLLAMYVPFCTMSIIANGSKIRSGFFDLSYACDDNQDYRQERHINRLVNIAILFNALLIFQIVRWVGTFNVGTIIYKFRVTTLYSPDLFPASITLLRYLFGLTQPLLIYIFLYNSKVKKFKVCLLLAETALIILIYAAKAMLIKFAVIVFCILFLKKKLNLKNILILTALVVVSLVFVTSSRDSAYVDQSNVIDYIFLYLLSALPALDLLLTGAVSYTNIAFGSNTLGFFYRVSGKIFSTEVPKINQISTFVPTPRGSINTNVFTALGMYYVDFGVLGILGYAIVAGLVFGWIYKQGFVRGKKIYVVLYILEVYALVTQFFGDVFFSYLSMPIQDFIWTLVVMKRLHHKKGGHA